MIGQQATNIQPLTATDGRLVMHGQKVTSETKGQHATTSQDPAKKQAASGRTTIGKWTQDVCELRVW